MAMGWEPSQVRLVGLGGGVQVWASSPAFLQAWQEQLAGPLGPLVLAGRQPQPLLIPPPPRGPQAHKGYRGGSEGRGEAGLVGSAGPHPAVFWGEGGAGAGIALAGGPGGPGFLVPLPLALRI